MARRIMPTPEPFFADHALSCRMEAAQAAQLAAMVQTVSERLPEKRAAALSIAGGSAVFFAPHVSVSRAVGLGMRGPVEAAAIQALEDFYRTRGTEARILVSPLAHPSLLEQLGERGFRVVDLDTVLVRRLDPGESFPALTGDAAVRLAGPEDAADWVRASLGGFSGSDKPAPRDLSEIFEAAFHVPRVAYFFAGVGGATAGTAAVYSHDSTAYLFATSTLEAHRRRGVQRALIAARLAFAREGGCDLAFTVTAPGSASQRNFERYGFRPVGSQALLIKRFD
jgi:GNAT superfamily N-acetyltransferase